MAKRNVVKEIPSATRRRFSAEEKIRIVLEGLRGETSVSELCRRERIATTVYYPWSNEFLKTGKNGPTKETKRNATSDEIERLREENAALKRAVAELVLDVQRYRQSLGM